MPYQFYNALAIDCFRSHSLVAYREALAFMARKVTSIINAQCLPAIWLLEHQSIYTVGMHSNPSHLLDHSVPVYKTNRGGQYTYHGPGQRIIYFMLDLKQLHTPSPDIKKFVKQIEHLIIDTLAKFGIIGFIDEENPGVWVRTCEKAAKIASLGFRIKHWVTFHGVAININTNLEYFKGIVPCGLVDAKSTSVLEFGQSISMHHFDEAFMEQFELTFNCRLNIIEMEEIL